MTGVDLHPEELFDALRAGGLNSAARGRLLTHCSRCESCRFELRLIEGAPFVHDEAAQAGRVAERALRSLTLPQPRAHDIAADSSAPRFARLAGAVAAALVLGCSLGAAAMVAHYPERLAHLVAGWISNGAFSSAAAPTLSQERRQDATQREPVVSAAPRAELALQPTAASPNAGRHTPRASDAQVRSPAHALRAKPTPTNRPKPASDDGDADAALGSATEAHSQGRAHDALERYRNVIAHYPQSSAASIARVAVGRLLFAELAQPSAALASFDAYLERSKTGSLSEEALYYRALCLGRLQRETEARDAFRELLERFPDSIYAPRARAQLAPGAGTR